jgi:hypothetical protein
VPTVTIQVQLDDEVHKLLRGEASERMKPVGELVRVAAGKWLVVTGASGRSSSTRKAG